MVYELCLTGLGRFESTKMLDSRSLPDINTKAAIGSFCITCMEVNLFRLSLPFEILVEEEQLEGESVVPVGVGVNSRAGDEGVSDVVVLHGFVQGHIDIVEEVVDAAIDDDCRAAFNRFHHPVVTSAALYVGFRAQTIELGDDGMGVPHFGVF